MSESYKQIISELKHVRVGDYLGCYYASDDECKSVIEGFAANALQKGHKLITFVSGHESQDIPESSAQGEINQAASHITGISRFANKDIPADGDAFISFLSSEVNKVLGSVWKGVRICLDISSLPAQFLSHGSFKSFMGKLLSLNRAESCIILCLYCMKKTPPNVLMESLSIYPRVIIGERLIDNTYFVPGGEADVQGLMHGAVKGCLEGLVRGEGFSREIRDLEDKYRFVFENTSDFMFFHDMEGFIKEMKLVDEEVEGYTEKDLLRLNLKDLIPARVRGEFDEYVKRVRAEGKAEGIIRLLSINGGERIFEYKSFLISGENGPMGARGLARDITERFNATEALVKSEEKYRDLFDSISDYVFTHDLEGNFDFEETNDMMKQSWGYRGEENRYSNIKDFMPDKYKPLFSEYLKRIKEKGKDKGLISVINTDGSELILEYRNSLIYEDGVPAGVRGIASDITDRIKGKIQLKRSEQRYRDIFNNVSDYLYFHDLEGYFRYDECNNTVRDNWKGMRDSQGRTNLRDIMPERFRGQLDQYLEVIIQKGQDEGPLCIIDKDGTERILEYRNTLTYDKEGNPVGVRGSARDITDRLHAEKQLKKSEEKYRTILESIEEGYYEIDLKGRFTFGNDSLFRILGTTSTELLGTNYASFMDDGVVKEISNTFHEVFESQKDKPMAEWEFIRKRDGRKICIEGSISRILSKDGRCIGFRGMIRDVTPRIQSEHALIESEQRYRNIFNNVSDFLYFHDLDGNFDFEETNEQAKNAWGYREKMTRRMNLIDLIPERHKPFFGEYLKRIKEKNLDEGLLTVIFTNDGKEHILEYKNLLVSKNGVPTGVQGSARDVTDRIQVQRQLKKSEEKYRSILESIEEGYYEVDLTENFTFANDSLCRITQVPMQELIGSNFSRFTDEDKAKVVSDTYSTVFNTGKDLESVEFEFIRNDGQRIYVEFSISRILSSGGECKGFRGITRDVTKRVQVEHKLKESEFKYRTILESIEEGYYEVDLKGNFAFSNDSLCRILGCTYEELIGMSYSSFVGDNTARGIYKTFNDVFTTGKDVESAEWEFFRKSDGEQIFIEVSVSRALTKSGELRGFQGIVRDVTKRVKAERALKDSEERYRTILESIEEGYYEVDLDGKITFSNDSMSRIFGCTSSELIGSNYSSFVKGGTSKVIFKTFNTVFKTGKDLGSTQWEFFRKNDGEQIFIEVSVSRILSKTGEVIGFRGMGRDVTRRVHAEHALKESEEKYRTILESIEEGYYEVNLDGTFTFCNGAICRITACRREELVGMNYRDLADGDNANVIFAAFHEVFKTGRDLAPVSWDFIKKGGERINCEISVSRVLSRSGECIGFRGIVRDVTKRVQAERALMESEHRYRLLAENVNDIIWTADLDFNFTYVSPSVKQVARTTVEETLKLNVRHVMSRELFKRVVSEFGEIMALVDQGEDVSHVVKRFEFEHTRGDGTEFWADTIASIQLDDNGKPIGFVGITRDITDRINADEEIRKNEAKYRSILESIEEGYYETDLAGNLTFFNDSLGRNMGFTAEEMKGRNYKILMDEEGARTVFQTFRRVFETGKPEKAFGWTLIRKDGSKVLTETSILLIRDSNGNPVGFRGLIRDVSERIQTEEFKAAKLKAEAENRAKSEFLANMSHEIRTPLNGIIGMTELAMDTSLDENQRDIVRVINRESEILLNLINDILDFSKIEADRYELEKIPFDLRILIEDLAHSFAMRSEKKGLEFISFVSPDVPSRLMGDPGRLRQVIANLAGNSLKFTEKGEIFIKVEKHREYKNKVSLKFSVRDTGIGIPKDKQERIFESFTQADGSTTRKYGGTGLGLAISKKIVEMMGGRSRRP